MDKYQQGGKKRLSVSEEWRNLGNEKFKSAYTEGIGKSVLAGRMEDAINLYQKVSP